MSRGLISFLSPSRYSEFFEPQKKASTLRKSESKYRRFRDDVSIPSDKISYEQRAAASKWELAALVGSRRRK
jgi:hypothetical protein